MKTANRIYIMTMLLLVASSAFVFNQVVNGKWKHVAPRPGEVWEWENPDPEENSVRVTDSILDVRNGQVYFITIKHSHGLPGGSDSLTESTYRSSYHFVR